MLTSATGNPSIPDHGRGFTLLELLVVVAIIGLVVSLAMLSFAGFTGARPDPAAHDLADRIALAEEESALTGRILGLRLVGARRIEFVALVLADGARKATWQPLVGDRVLGGSDLPEDLQATLEVDGATGTALTAAPQVLLDPGGDLTPFRMTFSTTRARVAPVRLTGQADGTLQVETLR